MISANEARNLADSIIDSDVWVCITEAAIGGSHYVIVDVLEYRLDNTIAELNKLGYSAKEHYTSRPDGFTSLQINW